MEPASLTLGALAAGLVAEACKRASERAVDGGEGALRRVVARVRDHFDDDADAASVILRLERSPDSELLVRELSELIARRADRDPAFARDLERLAEEAQMARSEARGVTQIASGTAHVQVVAHGSTVRISHGPQTSSHDAG